MSANALVMRAFEDGWIPLGDSGVAVMSAAPLLPDPSAASTSDDPAPPTKKW
ncbi:hypothetical protein [Streptomyces sp. NPDC005969]|uniref:hypothetical protein n=1 Tax=Streptomyces sp. NPDC005969 TaxID=3156722 RepID=UPI0033DF2D0B